LTPEQARGYRIADNQTATIAEWDDALLSDEVPGLQALNYDLANLGFDDDELKEMRFELEPVFVDVAVT
jgi:site-specific DNA-methyltransferase (adenine-specific)